MGTEMRIDTGRKAMLTWWQELLIALVGGIAGGGLVDTYLNWRRFQREQEQIRKEERRVAIDRIGSVCAVTLWDTTARMGDQLEYV